MEIFKLKTFFKKLLSGIIMEHRFLWQRGSMQSFRHGKTVIILGGDRGQGHGKGSGLWISKRLMNIFGWQVVGVRKKAW